MISTELQALDRLVGTWTVSGGAEGTVRYEWMDGGYFLLQHVDLAHRHQLPEQGIGEDALVFHDVSRTECPASAGPSSV